MTDKKNLEDALAEMEASNAKAAELRAKNAPELIADAVARSALNARLNALPQAQRRQVLDAAGLKHVSAAPPPITPLTGRGASYNQPRPKPAAPAIDWPFWKAMRTVKLWQACALIVGIDPDTLEPHPQAVMAGPGAGPVFDGKCFPSVDVRARFDKALRLAANAVSYMDGPIYPKGQPRPGNIREKDVLLSEVVAFFVSCEWANIPEPLHGITAPKGNQKPPAPIAVEQKEMTAKAAPTGPRLSITKAALITQHKHEWPTIEGDIRGASENGLSKAAKAGARDWYEDAAMQWARSKNKLIQPASTATLTSVMSSLPSRRHRLEG